MALSYEESNNLMQDQAFRGRVKVALLKYTTYIMNEPVDTTAHSSRYRWAQRAAAGPEIAVSELTPMIVLDGQVQLDGGSITDGALQTTTESVVNKFL
jgi:hypothetical protein